MRSTLRGAASLLAALLACFPLAQPAQAVQRVAGVTTVGTSTPMPVTVTMLGGGTADSILAVTGGLTNQDFSMAVGGTCANGTFYSTGQQCTAMIVFAPKYPGQRSGAVLVKTSGGELLGVGMMSGMASGSLPVLTPGRIDTVIGNGQWIYTGDGNAATSTPIFTPQGFVLDPAGNLYLCDSGNNRIRRVDAQSLMVTTIAGNGLEGFSGDGGLATAASLGSPAGLAMDGAGNLFVADVQNHVIRRIDAVSHLISTVAGTPQMANYGGDGGPATLAQLNLPRGIALDLAGNLLIADTGNNAIRRVDSTTRVITTLAGDGVPGFGGDGQLATSARLNGPSSAIALTDGSVVIADTSNDRIRRIDLSGVVETIAGTGSESFSGDGGPATAADLKNPVGLSFDPVGNLYIADSGNNRVRMVSAADGTISTLTGTGSEGFSGDSGPANLASHYGPYGLQFTAGGDLFVSDMFHMRIRRISGSNTSFSYATLRRGKISPPQIQSLANYGTLPLQMSTPLFVDSALDAATTTCSTTTALSPSDTCHLGIQFAPETIGQDVLGALSLPSNAPNVTPVLFVHGQVLDVNPTSVDLASSSNPSTLNGQLLFTATIHSDDMHRSGMITFASDGHVLCSPSLDASGMATCGTSSLTLGSHSITAAYAGDAQNAAANSLTLTQVVKQQATLVLTASPTPSIVTNPVVLTITASAATGTPTGTVTFYDGPASLGTGVLSSGQAQLSVSNLTVGMHSLVVQYGGDASDAAGQSNVLMQAVQQASTATTLATSNARVTVGTDITMTANVGSANGPVPTGDVQFREGSTIYGTAPLSSGVAMFTFRSLAAGAHQLVATYSGDTYSLSSSSVALTETIGQIGTTVALSSSGTPANAGATVHLLAQVATQAGMAMDGAITGEVVFTDGGITLGSVPLTSALTATLDVLSLTVGTHTVVATYNGATNYSSSNGALLQVIIRTATSVSAGETSSTILSGKPTSLVATVSSSTGIPTGTVTFYDANVAIGTVALNPQGVVTLSLSTLSVRSHTLTASYSGDSNYLPITSASWSLRVNQAETAVNLSGPSASVNVSASASFTSVLTGPGLAPTGALTLSEGATVIATRPVTNIGTVAFDVATLPIGQHSLTVSYSGDANNTASTSGAVLVTIQQAPTVTTLTTSGSPSVLGSTFTLTATTTSEIAGLTGTINFQEGAQVLGTTALRNGTASLTLATLPFGAHTVKAVFLGDTNHAGSSSTVLQQSIVQQALASLTSNLNPSNSGQSVVLTGMFPAVDGLVPTGVVLFKNGSSVLGTIVLDAVGVARLPTNELSVGIHTLSISYAGDPNFAGATAQLTQVVVNSTTMTTLTVSTPSAVYGRPVTLSASVASNGGVATGEVSFLESGRLIGSSNVSGGGVASLTLSTLTPGPHTVVATYVGDGNATASSAPPISFLVRQQTTLNLSSAANPALSLSNILITATLTNQNAAPATGSISLTDGSTTVATAPLNALGVVSFSLPPATIGTHALVANYVGDDADLPAQAPILSQAVQQRSTNTTLTAASTNAKDAQQLTLIAIVQSPSPSVSTLPGGTVTFANGSTDLGTAPIDAAGVATLTIVLDQQIPVSVVARYNGDVPYAGSTSTATKVTAGPAAQFVLSLSDSEIKLQRGQKTTVRISVASIKSFSDTLRFGCVGLPYAATCTFNKQGIALAADGSGTLELTVDTGNPLGQGASTTASLEQGDHSGTAALCLLPAAMLLCALRKRSHWKLLVLLIALSAVTLENTGCSGLQTNSTPVGSYTFQVTAIGQGSGAKQAQTITMGVSQ